MPSRSGFALAERSFRVMAKRCRTHPASTTCWRTSSEDRQELVDFVRRDLHAVVLPLRALDLDEAVEGVLAEDAEHQLGLGRNLDCLAERLGKLLDPPAVPLL